MSELGEVTYGAGHVIYKEGDPGNAVFIITDGKVEVVRLIRDEPVRLTVLSAGAIFGESGVIRNTARSTTVRAITPVTLMVISKEAFDSVFKRENPLALKLLRALSDRLAAVHSQLMTHHLYTEGALQSEVGAIRLLAGSPEMQAQIGVEGVVIKTLPFHIGRHLRPEEKATVRKADLMVQASAGAEISPLHFSIESEEGRLIVRDHASHLGTKVNEQRIGHFEEFSTADLLLGTTSLQAGGMDSPYRFEIIVERAEQAEAG